MPSQRDAIAMTPDELTAYLGEARNLVLVTQGRDGFPDPVAMWYVPAADGSLWMRTYAKSQKVVNLRRNPMAAVLVESGSRYAELRGVQLKGHIELIDDVEVICGVFAELMIRYEGMDRQYRSDAMEGYRSKAPKQVAMHFIPDVVASWDHSKQSGGL